MLVFLSLLALAYAHNGTCPASKKCSTSGETGLPCCQISSSNFECCSSTEACIPNVGCRCALQYSGYNFELFLQEFSKSYEEPEFKRRQAIFESNLKTIRAHNAEYKAGVHTWHMAVNQFADWSKEEFKAISTTEYRPSVQPRSLLDITKRRPKSMDWRSKGMVTKVKNQGASQGFVNVSMVLSCVSHSKSVHFLMIVWFTARCLRSLCVKWQRFFLFHRSWCRTCVYINYIASKHELIERPLGLTWATEDLVGHSQPLRPWNRSTPSRRASC